VNPPKIDCHVHLAGQGTDDSGCWVSPAFTRRVTYKLLRLRHRPTDVGHADAEWAAELADRVRRSELDYAVALGFDGVYDRAGRFDPLRSQMVIPSSWVFEVCRRHPELLPGPSVNPHRRDALDALEECIEGGAALIKWLPATQDIDPGDRSLGPFYRRLAETGIPILVHSGGSEQTFAQVSPDLKDLRRILFPLEQGVRMIVAHTAAPVTYARDPDQVPMLKRMLERFPHLSRGADGFEQRDGVGALALRGFRQMGGAAAAGVDAERLEHGERRGKTPDRLVHGEIGVDRFLVFHRESSRRR
jgi:hypothetical protein